ncbi:hypothetical protein KXD40_009012 [Peronospora effusa]|uniref:Uncharacterized protein n=1 Tax=Peronospora effusa TaxID=542832 RepID=A0A3M6VN56_9STRA|nr:hypothetical protein DD238_007457 [Peronospora effusa]RQM14453.1 hypothetical protein DD237_005675 [Peronospora effusa]UIZ25342.1 hypothetical protein KXD40_009012 [Peronospora effusa]CAI5701290.1 unnamed protein product [Peronospora effusa]
MPTTSSGLEEPINFFQCPRHDEETTVTRTWNSDANNSLRRRFAIGDVVLVLELNNAFLPLSVKTAAPDAANHWGVVVSVEEMEPRECGIQLLKVRMFADENVLAVPNQYAMRITAASDFSRPVDLIRHCVQRHAMVELQLRQMEGKINDAEAKRILLVSNTAFTARLKKLGVTAAQAMSDAEEGLARWRQFHDLAEPRQYDGLGEAAPIYLYIDTRGSRPGQQNSGSTNTANVVADAVKDVEGDVSMTDADTNNGGAAIHGSTFGSPHLKRPESAGKSPHEAEIEQSAKTEAILVDTRLICCSRLKQSQTSTEDTMLTDAQDTQPENDSLSWSRESFDVTRSQNISSTPACMNTPSSDVVGSDANRNQLTSDVTKCADTDSAKRQKLSTESRVHFNTAVCTPTKTIHKFFPGATLSSASAPATLHISPMASSARTLFSQKRKELTRKQKLLAEMPPLVMKELEREALRYLEEADELKLKLARIPADVDAFPWAARATRFRPAFYRPTVMLGHGGLRRPGLDAVSRLLVSQDKRSIKCFVQTLETNAEVSRCTHLRKTTTAASPGFMLLDLLSLRSFRDLESVVRRRVVEALGKRSRYMREYFGMDAHQARRWLEQQRCKKTCDQPPITLSYCAADGVRRHLYLHEVSPKPSPKDMQAWLCFCANVCHVSVAIKIQSVARSTLTPITTALQPVSATQ